MTWGVMEELFFSPLFCICGTMWYVSELWWRRWHFSRVLLYVYLIGIDWVFIIYYYFFCFYGNSFILCLKFIWKSLRDFKTLFLKANYFLKVFENVESFMIVKMRLVLWIAGVFRHDSGVCHIVYGVWGGYRRALPFSPFIFMCGTIWYVSGWWWRH